MKNFVSRYGLRMGGLAIGAIAGYAYYYYVGCVTGSCPLSSNPWSMTFYGAVMGYLFLDLFRKKDPQKKNK